MMLDRMHGAAEVLLRQVALEIARDIGALAALTQPAQHIARTDARRQYVDQLAPTVRTIVAVDRDVVDVAQGDAGFGQAIADRFAGKATPVLDPPEPLLLDGRNQFAILHQAGRRVGVKGVEAQDVCHREDFLAPVRSRSRRSRCIDRIRSAVMRWAV